MKRRTAMVAIAAAACAAAGARAADNGSADEAVAMVKKTIAFMKANGDEKTFAEVSNPKGQFVDRDLYVFIAVIGGNTMAHGANPRMIGKRMADLKDRNDKYFIREFDAVVEAKGSGWVDYMWTHPVTKEIVQKSTYVEKFGKYVIGCGIYK